MAGAFSATPLDYLRQSRHSLVFQGLPRLCGPQAYNPGLVLSILAVVGVSIAKGLRINSRYRLALLLSLGIVAFVLSLGPYLRLGGVSIVRLPFWFLFQWVPGFALVRAPGRFAVIVLIVATVFGAFGFDYLRKSVGRRERLLTAMVLIMGTFFALPRDLPVQRFPLESSMPCIYRELDRVGDRSPVLELPAPKDEIHEAPIHATRQLYNLYHNHPRLDGVSGFVSRDYERFRSVMRSFPDSASIDAATAQGAGVVILHFGDYPASQASQMKSAIAESRRLERIAECGDDALFRLKLD